MKPVTSKGKQSTREIILEALKTLNQAKVDDLAQIADVSPVTVRHHLNALQANNLVEVTSVRRKVGRPYYLYNLSEKGLELFPRKYVRLTNRLLEEMKEQMPAEQVQEIFNGIVRNIVNEHRPHFGGLSFEQRLTYLVNLLSEEGFMAQWEKINDEYFLTEYSCPYYSLGSAHAEICTLDKELVVSVLETPIHRQRCMLEGDNCCQFTFAP